MSKRQLYTHEVRPDQPVEAIEVFAIEAEGREGLVPSIYEIQLKNNKPPVRLEFATLPKPGQTVPNGITIEALLAVCQDRLRCFQLEPLANEHNASAIAAIEIAQQALRMRTLDRQRRDVEGTDRQ